MTISERISQIAELVCETADDEKDWLKSAAGKSFSKKDIELNSGSLSWVILLVINF